MNPKQSILSCENGLSLIEVMIAMVLGIILTYGASEIYVNSKRNVQQQDDLGILQENARLVFEALRQDLMSAGYIGCGNIASLEVNHQPSKLPEDNVEYSASTIISGHEEDKGNWSPPLPSAITETYPGSDVITIRSAHYCSAPLTDDVQSLSAAIEFEATGCQIYENHFYLISDCSSADLIAANLDNESGILNHSGSLSKIYTTEAQTELFGYRATTYYVRADTSNNDLPTLYVEDISVAKSQANALVAGVESLQFIYGIDTDSDSRVDRYIPADEIGDWSQVYSVNVALLMRSSESVGDPAFIFRFGDDEISYPPGPFRKQFQTTIALRNSGQASS